MFMTYLLSLYEDVFGSAALQFLKQLMEQIKVLLILFIFKKMNVSLCLKGLCLFS